MTKNPIVVSPDTDVAEAQSLLRRHRVRHLPVVESGRLVSFIGEKDLQKACPSAATTLSRFEIRALLEQVSVREIMPHTLVLINQNAPIEDAARLFQQTKHGGLPVVDDSGLVVGVITETDIFACFAEIMGAGKGPIRLTLTVDNRPGVIAEIGTIFGDLGINIDRIAAIPIIDDQMKIIIRGNFSVEEVVPQLEAKGYKVAHVSQSVV